MPASQRYQKVIQYFLQGLLILGPVTITMYAIYVIFDKIDNILRPVINMPGIGFVIIIVFKPIALGFRSKFLRITNGR